MRRLGNRMFSSRQDSNHTEIINGLRKIGYAVLDLKSLGGGAPDLLVTKGLSPTSTQLWGWLIEIKTDKGTLNAKQKKWRENWVGPQPITARSLEEILDLIQ